jgi:hypothetical protein
MNPAARREGVLVRELPGELLVYDQGEHRAHCLNRTAATVFRNADGTRSVADLGRLLAPQVEPAESEAVVEESLVQLAEAGLLEAAGPPAGWSRRQWVQKAGVAAAVLLPAVASVLVPAPAEAAATCVTNCTGKLDGTPCTCFGSDPCTASCVGQACSDGGGCP